MRKTIISHLEYINDYVSKLWKMILINLDNIDHEKVLIKIKMLKYFYLRKNETKYIFHTVRRM